MLKESDLKDKSFAINYLWHDTTHLLRAGIDENKNLYLLEYKSYPPKTVYSEIANFVNTKREYFTFSNLFEPLRLECNCKQFHADELDNLTTFYDNLIATDRLIIVEGINLPTGRDFETCLQILLKGLMTRLVTKVKKSLFLPTPTDDDVRLIGYVCDLSWEGSGSWIQRDLPLKTYESYMERAGYAKMTEERAERSNILTAIWSNSRLTFRAHISGDGEWFSYHDEIPV